MSQIQPKLSTQQGLDLFNVINFVLVNSLCNISSVFFKEDGICARIALKKNNGTPTTQERCHIVAGITINVHVMMKTAEYAD